LLLAGEEFADFDKSALATQGRLDGRAFGRDEANARVLQHLTIAVSRSTP
jgi:hypothetical protein